MVLGGMRSLATYRRDGSLPLCETGNSHPDPSLGGFGWAVRYGWQGSGSGQRMAPRFLVQRLWCHVKTVRPDDGPRLGIDSYLGEVDGVAQGFEDAQPLLRREVDVTDRPVIE